METTIPRARVWILNVNPGQVATDFADSLAGLTVADITKGWYCLAGKYETRSGANITRARNDLVAQFLDTTDGEWALFLDSDMVFPEDTIVRLLAAARLADTKIIGGLCVQATEHGPVPTLFQPAPEGAPTITVQHTDYPENTVAEVAATGTACLMIHRDVLEAMRAASPQEQRYCWFQETVKRAGWVSEDVEFCLRARDLGFSVYVDTTLSIGHYKWGRIWRPEHIKTKVGFPDRPLVAVIPMRDHLDLTEALVQQLLDQRECHEIVIVDNGSTDDVRQALADGLAKISGVTVLDMPDVGIHHMWNRAAEHALDKHGHRAHIAFLNNDLVVGAGFMGALSRALDSHPQLVAVSGNYDGRRLGGSSLGRNEPVQEVADICAGRYDGTGGLAGFAFMAAATLFGAGYRFPEDCMWWYGDNDLVGIIRAGGGRVGIAIRAEVEHLDGGGQTAGDWADQRYAEQLEVDRRAFEARWAALTAPPPAEEAWDPQALAAGARA